MIFLTIQINGKPETVSDDQCLLDLLTEKGLDPDTLVIEINGDLLTKERFSAVRLKPGDHVEILRFVGGG